MPEKNDEAPMIPGAEKLFQEIQDLCKKKREIILGPVLSDILAMNKWNEVWQKTRCQADPDGLVPVDIVRWDAHMRKVLQNINRMSYLGSALREIDFLLKEYKPLPDYQTAMRQSLLDVNQYLADELEKAVEVLATIRDIINSFPVPDWTLPKSKDGGEEPNAVQK